MTGLTIDWAACLQQPVADRSELLLSDGMFNLGAVLVIVAVMIAAPMALWARRRYRHAVTRLMGLEQVVASPARSASATAPVGLPPQAPALATADMAAVARAGMRRLTRATLLAWLGFGLLGVGVAVAIGPQIWPQRLAFGAGAMLLALGPVMTNLPPRWSAWSQVAGLAGGLAAVMLLNVPEDGAPESDGDPWWQTAAIVAPLVLAYALMFHRRLRGQVQPLAVLVSVSLLATVLPFAWLEWVTGTCMQEVSALPEGAPEAALLWLLLLTPLILFAVWLGFRALTGLATLIEHGWLSELSLGCALCLGLIALAMVFALAPEASGDVQFAHVAAPAVWLLGSLVVYALALGRAAPPGPAPQLLVLRVFSHDTRRHDLLDGLQARWRYLGPVHQIGGPDMVAMNIDPYEATMFLSSQLHTLFLPAATDTAQLQARLDIRPDHDGRYRINEVFCFNTAWRRTVEQLMQLSDAIVLDLRGLTAQREGTSYEIGRLAALGRLDRVLALGDADTDWAHVDALLRRHGAEPQALQRLQVTADQHDRHAPDALFQRLAQTGGPALRSQAAA